MEVVKDADKLASKVAEMTRPGWLYHTGGRWGVVYVLGATYVGNNASTCFVLWRLSSSVSLTMFFYMWCNQCRNQSAGIPECWYSRVLVAVETVSALEHQPWLPSADYP